MLQKSAFILFHPWKDVLSFCQSPHQTLKQKYTKKKKWKNNHIAIAEIRAGQNHGKSQ